MNWPLASSDLRHLPVFPAFLWVGLDEIDGNMEKIIELNNLAVACINANKIKEAVNRLGCALQLTKTQFYMMLPPPSSHQSCHETSMHHHETAANQETLCSNQHDDVLMTQIMAANSNRDQHRMIDRQPLFKYSSEIKYQNPIPMFPGSFSWPITPLSIVESETTRVIGMSMIIVFNLALCFDLLASTSLSTTTKQQAFIAKAISLYEKVVDLHLQSVIEDSNMNATTVDESCDSQMVLRAQQDMVVMAAVNNLIQLHPDSLEKERYSSLIMVLFQGTQWTNYGSEEIQTLVDSQARVFVSNMVIASSNMLSISAATA